MNFVILIAYQFTPKIQVWACPKYPNLTKKKFTQLSLKAHEFPKFSSHFD